MYFYLNKLVFLLIIIIFLLHSCNKKNESTSSNSDINLTSKVDVLMEIDSIILDNNKINKVVVLIYDSAQIDIISGRIKSKQDFNQLYLPNLTYQRNHLKKNIECINNLINKHNIKPIEYRPIIEKSNDSIIEKKIESIKEFKFLK